MEAAVIGTVFTDIKGFSNDKYQPLGRNLGRVDLFQGGVGRNVAENLAGLGLSVRFVSSVDEGLLGNGVVARLEAARIDTAYVKKVPFQGMGIWILINDKGGEQAGSLSQLPDTSHIEGLLDSFGDEIISGADNVILEADISEKVTRKVLELAAKHQKKVYALPANMDTVLKMPELFPRCECFICNDIEAGRLFGLETAGLGPDGMLPLLKDGIKKLGIPMMVVTMGAGGAVYCDSRAGLSGHVPAEKVEVVDCSGAGDSFFSGSVAALIRGLPLDRAVVCGTRLAALTIQSTSCNCDMQTIKEAKIL